MVDYSFRWNYDSIKGIPGTYSEAWEQAISEAWESIVEQSDAVPGESEKDKPTEGDEDEKDDPEGGGGGSGGSNNDQEEPPEGGDDNSDFDMDKLTRSQQRSVRTIQNIIEDHLTESDLSGALEELEGNPIERPDGGFWNHVQEVKDAYTGLLREIHSLEGSLQNPNLDPEVHFFLQYIYDTACEYIHIIEEMFEPYGGIN